MTNEQLIEIVEKFDKWLDDTAAENGFTRTYKAAFDWIMQKVRDK